MILQKLLKSYLLDGGKLSKAEILEVINNEETREAFVDFVYDKLFATTESDVSSDVELATKENTIGGKSDLVLESSENDVPTATPEADALITDAESVQIPEWCFVKLDDPDNQLFNNPRFSKEALASFEIIKERARMEGIKYVGQLVEGGFAKLSGGGVNDHIQMLKRRIKSLYCIEVGTKITGFAEAIADEVAQFEAQKKVQCAVAKRKEAKQHKENLMITPLAELPVFCSDADIYKNMSKHQRRSMKSCMTRLYKYLASEGFKTLNDIKNFGEEVFKGMVPEKYLIHFEKMQKALGINVF